MVDIIAVILFCSFPEQQCFGEAEIIYMWSKSLIKIIVTFDADGYCYNGQNNTNY